MRTLALDLGTQRIGVAISDEMNCLAHPLEVFSLKKGGVDCFLKELQQWVEKYQVVEILIGLPVKMNGTLGPTAQETLSFAEEVKKFLRIPVKVLDERLTTLQGEKLLIKADMSRRKRRRVIDSIAAQILLQGYLDSRLKDH